MKLPAWATTVTPFSKKLALFLYIFLPFAGFYLGMHYQEKLDESKQYVYTSPVSNISPTPSITALPTVDPTFIANWKTYIDTANTYSIKYPEDAQRVSANNKGLFFSAGAPINPYQTGLMDQYNVEVYLSPYQNLSTALTDMANSFKDEGITHEVKDVFINASVPAKQFIAYGGHDGVSKSVYTFIPLKNGKLLEITMAFSYKNRDKYEAQANQMLSTFTQQAISPTCIPRPACLDATPRCMIPESKNMCPKPTEAVMCTQDVRLCPDGSYVGRTGQNCEFAPCLSHTP